MFGIRHYVPLLKGKSGEFKALRELSDEHRAHITPLIDVPRHDMLRSAKKTLDEHLVKVASQLAADWGVKFPVFVDLFDLPMDFRAESGEHPIACLMRTLRQSEVMAIPVTGLDRDQYYNENTASAFVQDRRGICVRLQIEDIEVSEETDEELQLLVKDLGARAEDIDLLIDLRSIRALDLGFCVNLLGKAINDIRSIEKYRSFTIAASSMPRSISEEIAQNAFGHISRQEIKLWRALYKNGNNIPRMPTYGDYATVHPDFIDVDPRIFANTMGPTVRYTVDRQWLVARGRSFQQHPDGYKQYYSLAKQIAGDPGFMGKDFSFGDNYIDQRANGVGTSGNPHSWVTASTNHHLAFVSASVRQGLPA